jgi:energy-coupling factor transporter ATP-binding protein EcfA2
LSRRSLIELIPTLPGTLVIASHDLDLTFDPCDRAIVLDGGRVACGEYGWPHEIMKVFGKDGQLTCLVEWFFEYPRARVVQQPPLGAQRKTLQGSHHSIVPGSMTWRPSIRPAKCFGLSVARARVPLA